MRPIFGNNMKTTIGVVVLTLAQAVLWQATGGESFTKYEVVNVIDKAVDPTDPFAQAGLYDDNRQSETVITNDFRFGLLPATPNPFDKHFVAVSTLLPPAWTVLAIILWHSRRRANALLQHPRS